MRVHTAGAFVVRANEGHEIFPFGKAHHEVDAR